MDNVHKTFLCACCFDVIQTPVTTDCGHNFCLECIQQYISNLDDNDINDECPICRQNKFLSTVRQKIKRTQQNGSEKCIEILKTNMILEKILLEIKCL